MKAHRCQALRLSSFREKFTKSGGLIIGEDVRFSGDVVWIVAVWHGAQLPKEPNIANELLKILEQDLD